MLGQGAKAPSIEVKRFVQSAFSMANFFKSILCVKTGEVEAGPQREKLPGGTKVDTGPPNLIGPLKPYRGPTPLNYFSRMGVDLHLKVRG